MGIMLLIGAAPKKFYTRTNPASESLNNPIPLLSAHRVSLERDKAIEEELLTERKEILGHVSLHLCSEINLFTNPFQTTFSYSARSIDERH